jgi:CubicO group peptidase (beta-lactamase class C family)
MPKGFTTDGLFAMGAMLQSAARGPAAPGLVALVDRAGQTEVIAAGTKSVGGPPMARDTLFRIASMTKLVTATAVMMLVEDGRLRLDEPVDRLLPELANRRVLRRPDGPLDDTVPASRPITVEDLLTFRCGWGLLFAPPTTPILKAVADLGIVGFGPPDPTMPFTPDQWIAKLGTLPLMAQPGEAWRYTTGSDIQGVLIARATGQSLPAVFEERILGPLGMKDTAFHVPAAKRGRLCASYLPAGAALTLVDDPAHTQHAEPPKFPEGDAGLISCADDLLAFSHMLLGGGAARGKRLLSDASVKAMTRNHVTPAQVQAGGGQLILGSARGWGYGMSVVQAETDGLQPGAFGWSGGRGTSWYMDPAKGLTTIFLTNRLFTSPDPPATHKAFWKAAYAALA